MNGPASGIGFIHRYRGSAVFPWIGQYNARKARRSEDGREFGRLPEYGKNVDGIAQARRRRKIRNKSGPSTERGAAGEPRVTAVRLNRPAPIRGVHVSQ